MSLKALLNSPELEPFEHIVFDISRNKKTEIVVPKWPTPERVTYRINLIKRLLRFSNKNPHDIVHIQCSTGHVFDFIGDILLLWFASKQNKPLIWHWHKIPQEVFWTRRPDLRIRLFNKMISPANIIFVLLDEYKQYLQRLIQAPPIKIVPNTCDPSLAEIKRLNMSEKIIRVLFVGRLTREKGFFDLMDVFTDLWQEDNNVLLEIAGLPNNKSDRKMIEGWLIRNKDNINYEGVVSGNEKIHLFRRADILVLPSYRESFGIVALEAMASGLPVIGTSVAGLSSVVEDGVTGFLFQPGHKRHIKQLLEQLIRNPDLRRKMGRAGRIRYKEKFSPKKVGKIVADTYRELL